ncbi:hypothetical protein TNCV_3497981 [Trichonephila clavipes]|nr:hypothetical protein TNCV_3497981 [Trichonephila clavipes]
MIRYLDHWAAAAHIVHIGGKTGDFYDRKISRVRSRFDFTKVGTPETSSKLVPDLLDCRSYSRSQLKLQE